MLGYEKSEAATAALMLRWRMYRGGNKASKTLLWVFPNSRSHVVRSHGWAFSESHIKKAQRILTELSQQECSLWKSFGLEKGRHGVLFAVYEMR